MTDRSVSDAMMEGEPYKRYRKTILGKVYVTAINPFSDEPEGVILEGNPNNPADESTQTIEMWDERQDLFFRRVNTKHFETGRLEVVGAAVEPEPSPNALTEEQVDALLDGRKTKWFAFKSRLNDFTDEAPLFRLVNRARELEKSEKVIKHIEERLAEMQLSRYEPESEETE